MTKGEGQRKAKRHTQPAETKEGRELVPLVVQSYLTHINQLNDAKKNLLSVQKKKFSVWHICT
jgi:hypothetical protein